MLRFSVGWYVGYLRIHIFLSAFWLRLGLNYLTSFIWFVLVLDTLAFFFLAHDRGWGFFITLDTHIRLDNDIRTSHT